MLQELIDKLISQSNFPRRLSVEDRLRKKKLKEIKRYCDVQGFDFYPQELTRLPFFADEINDHIESSAIRELPVEQFEERLKVNDLSKWVEISGFLGYNDSLFVMSHLHPDSDNVRLVMGPYGDGLPEIKSSSPGGTILTEDIEKADYIIRWHTHPIGWSELSKEDAKSINENIKRIGEDKPIYFVVYTPAMNKSIWYQAKRFSD